MRVRFRAASPSPSKIFREAEPASTGNRRRGICYILIGCEAEEERLQIMCPHHDFGHFPSGRVAQLAEHSTLNRQVGGSIPPASTTFAPPVHPACIFTVHRVSITSSSSPDRYVSFDLAEENHPGWPNRRPPGQLRSRWERKMASKGVALTVIRPSLLLTHSPIPLSLNEEPRGVRRTYSTGIASIIFRVNLFTSL